VAFGAIAVTACSEAATDNQAAADNLPAAEVPADGVATGAADETGSVSATGNGEPPSVDVSSGMPVPGTNTPEHIVVNDDGPIADGNRR